LNGKLRLQIHYYEDGNVQMNAEKNATIQLKFSVHLKNLRGDLYFLLLSLLIVTQLRRISSTKLLNPNPHFKYACRQ
jgi:hypothetical protein